MNGPRWLASPLAGTACVLTALALLAIPLRQLTSSRRPSPAPAPAPVAGALHAVLRLRLLAPAGRVVVHTDTGAILLDRRNLGAGESEHDAVIPWEPGGLDLRVQADFAAGTAETAVFLTIMPDGYQDQTRYGIGLGRIDEPLRYDWHPPLIGTP
ncbi:MAG: hypothetical protein WCJ14_07115 [Verrucomicrobiota bacterium]